MMKKIGKYEVTRELGRGVTSTVYLARDPVTERQVAVKMYNAHAFEGEGSGVFQKLFVNESLLAGKLTHPNVVGIYEGSIADDYGYLVMEFVSGSTLERFSTPDHLLPIARVLEIIHKAARALDYAQRNGIIHRDIKPANVLLSSDGEVKVSDFGASLNMRSEAITQVSGIGSLAYMSPEQTRDQSLTFHTDVYSLGVVFYRLLTGALPFTASSDGGLIYQIQNIAPPPPSKHRPDLPPPLDAIVMKTLAKDAAERYRTWDEFVAELTKLRPALDQAPIEPSTEEKFALARDLRFFAGFSPEALTEVLTMGRWYHLPMGTPLIRQGDGGQSFFILVSGEVRVSKDRATLSVLRAGECFGEMAYLSKRKYKRLADVMAMTDVTVMEIDPDLLWIASKACQDNFNQVFFEILVERLHASDSRLVEILNESRVTMFT